jgi:uncharacterized protein
MIKPRGAICNLDCAYCYFLSKEQLYPDSNFCMSDSLLENFTHQYITTQNVSEVTFSWQGGEPTLMGLGFFKRAVAYQEQYARPGMRIINALQTNGTMLNDEWCAFFKESNFLIGISIDGPRELHDIYRRDKGGAPTFNQVMRGLSLLKKHGVDTNILCTINAGNQAYPQEVYHFLRDEVRAKFIQFIPIVEWENNTGFQERNKVTLRSVNAEAYGLFLIEIFNEWVRRDIGQVYVQIFDVALGSWLGLPSGLCLFAPRCGSALALEHNGDLYSCDHFVEPKYRLGNIEEQGLSILAGLAAQQKFGADKHNTLPDTCLKCEVRFACHGGCPKNRIIQTPQGESGLNYLCASYLAFFRHIDQPMKFMANEIRNRRSPANVMRCHRRKDPCP